MPSPKRSVSGEERSCWALGRPAETRSFMSVGSAPRSPRCCASSATDKAGRPPRAHALHRGTCPGPLALPRPPGTCPGLVSEPSPCPARPAGLWAAGAAGWVRWLLSTRAGSSLLPVRRGGTLPRRWTEVQRWLRPVWQRRMACGFGDYGEGRSDQSASVPFARDVLIRGGRQGVGAPHCPTPVRSVSLRTSGVRGHVAARPFCTWGRRTRRPLSRCRGPPRFRG